MARALTSYPGVTAREMDKNLFKIACRAMTGERIWYSETRFF
ncbi:hypothetical protein [Aeromonas encheleia]